MNQITQQVRSAERWPGGGEEELCRAGSCFCLWERTARGREYRKHLQCPKAAREKRKCTQRTEQKREKLERRGFKFHQDSINRGSAESETLQLDTWWCSGGKGESPEAERKRSSGSSGHMERGGSPAERKLGRGCAASPQTKVPNGPQRQSHSLCWNKDVKGSLAPDVCCDFP